ncbi:MAG: Loki-CTERM sorting domain-containing protein [Promethearchaeota archaeon]
MKRKLLLLSMLVLFVFIPTKTYAFERIDDINNGISVFFLIGLNTSETIEINVTHTGSGNFELFLFDARPVDSYINIDNTINPEIYNQAINYSLNDNPYINYSVSSHQIYYIQLVLLENGPDTFFLYCNHELVRYYLPTIPGYNVEFILLTLALSLTIFLIFRKKKVNVL